MVATKVNPSAQNITQFNVQTGASNNNLNNVAPSSTSGVPLISQGASSQPVFGTAVAAGGGTGVTTWTDTNSLLCTGTTSTGAVQDVASVATGQVLTSAGTSTLPVWSDAPTLTSITFGSGTALSTYVEGTWTPNIQIGGSSTGITYTTQIGYYTQINNAVLISLRVLLSSKGSNTGTVTISNMPVAFGTHGGTQVFVLGRAGGCTFAAGSTNLALSGSGSGSTVMTFVISNFTSGAAPASMANTDISNVFGFGGAGVYYIL